MSEHWLDLHFYSTSYLFLFNLNSYLSQSHLRFDICMIFICGWSPLWLDLIFEPISSRLWHHLWLKTDLRFYLTWFPLWPKSLFKLITTRFWHPLWFPGSLIWNWSSWIDIGFDKIFDLQLLLELISLWLDWSPLWQPLWLETAVTQSQMKLAKKVQFESRSHSPPCMY